MAALLDLEAAYTAIRSEPAFWAELRELGHRYVGRPTPVYRADRLARALERRAGRERGPPAPVPQARGPRPHRCAQDQQRARPGAPDAATRQATGHRRDRRRPARRRDRDRVRAARPRLRRLHGRRGHPPPGAQRAADARARHRGPRGDVGHARRSRTPINEAMRDWVTNVATTHYVLGSAVGPHPFPALVRDLQRVIGDEAAAAGPRRSRGGCRTSRSRASAAARTRSA